MIHHAIAETPEDIARLLRLRGRTVITAPARIGKTTELIRYAEERYPNGRFAVVARPEDHPKIITLHWRIFNGYGIADAVAARLLGKPLEGEDVIEPMLYTPESIMFRRFNSSTPTFVDEWFSLTEAQQREIINRRLFIAAVTGEPTYASSQEDQDR